MAEGGLGLPQSRPAPRHSPRPKPSAPAAAAAPTRTPPHGSPAADPLAARLTRIRSFAASAKRRADLYGDIARIDDKGTARSLGSVQRASAPGKKLQKIGFIMLWIPEPTMVTAAVGGPMILAGRYLDKKYNGSTISDVGSQTRNTLSTISDFKGTINNPA